MAPCSSTIVPFRTMPSRVMSSPLLFWNCNPTIACIRHDGSAERARYLRPAICRGRPVAQQAFCLVVPMLILMVKKYANLLLGLAVAGAIAGPMAYFHFFDRGKTPSQAAAAEPQAGVTQAASYGAASPAEGAAGSEITANIAGPATPGTATAPRIERAGARRQQRLRFPNHARMDRGPLAGRIDRAGPASIGRLPRAAGHGHRPARSGRIFDLLLQCRAEAAADHLHRHDGRPQAVDRAADQSLPSDAATGERSGPGRLRGGPLQQPTGQQSADPPGAAGRPTILTGATTSSFPWNGPATSPPTFHRRAAERRRGRARPWAAANRARSAARSRRSGRCGRCRCSG